jgi:high-affinity Fe2+/Pb2+ permease
MGISQGTTFAGLINIVIGYINQIIPVLLVLAIVLLFIGIIRYIHSSGKKSYRNSILWSLVVIFVLVSVWGLLRILTNTFLGGNASPGGAPTQGVVPNSFQGVGAQPY